MAKVKLPILGYSMTIGKTNTQQPTSALAPTQEKLTTSGNSLIGGFFSFGKKALSTETTVSPKLLKANTEWVFRNNDVIAKNVAQIEFKLYRVKFVQGDFEYEEIKQHEILDRLDRFNEGTSKVDGIYITSSHKTLTGDSFWLKETSNGKVKNFYTLEPDKVELVLGDFTKETQNIIQGYKYKTTINNKTIEIEYAPDEIIHFKTPNPSNPFRGLGRAEAIAETIDLDSLTNALSRQFFENGAMLRFILTTDKNLQEEQVNRLKKEFQAAHGGIRNAFKIGLFHGGIKPEIISSSNKDMEFLAQLEWYRDKIMVAFGNTKASLGIIDDVNRASHESSVIAWKQGTVKPEMQAICDTLNEFWVPDYGEDLILTFEDPVEENRQALLDEAKLLSEQKLASVNEIRELLGMSPEDGEPYDQVPVPGQMPADLQNIDVQRVFRKRKLYTKLEQHQVLREKAKKLAEKIIKDRQKPVVKEVEQEVEAPREHAVFSNDKVWEYWAKQIAITEIREGQFKNRLEKIIQDIKEETLSNYPETQPKHYQKALVDEDKYIVRAEFDLLPILRDTVAEAGIEALILINADEPYIPDVDDEIKRQIRKFATSMLSTEQDKMAEIIAQGLKEGKSIPEIRRAMSAEFDNLTRVQSERITRTEVLKANNFGAVDAWEQSGLVEGKQWLTAEDDRVDPECARYNGKIIGLKDYYTKTEYDTVDEPPLHPNCRCTVLPIVKATERLGKEFKERIADLEAQLDKRTKEYRDFKTEATEKQLSDEKYIKGLEELVDEKTRSSED